MSSEPDVKSLASTLSTSYSALLEYKSLPNQKIVDHLVQLATHSQHLPLSWFTDALLRALLTLTDRFIASNHRQSLTAIISLLSVWARRLSGDTEAINREPLLPNVLTLFSDQLIELPLADPATLDLRKNCWLGLVALVGRAPEAFNEEKLLGKMMAVVAHYESCEDAAMVESLNAGVAHALAESTQLNVFEYATLQQLLDTTLSMNAKRPLEGPWAACTLMEHAVDIRSRLTPITRAEADLDTLFTITKNLLAQTSNTWLHTAIAVGFVRVLQFNQGEKTKKIDELQAQLQTLTVTSLANLLTSSLTTDEKDTFAFFCGQCVPSMPMDTLGSLDLKLVLYQLIDQLLTSPHTWQQGRFLRQDLTADQLDTLQDHRLFKDIGRLSRAIGKVVHAMLELHVDDAAQAIQAIVDRLEGFSYNVLFDWDRYLLSHGDAVPTKEIDAKIWTIFKTLAFSLTAVLKAIAVDVLDGQGLIDVPQAAQGIVSLYANINFISEKLGLGNGFQAYQETLTNAVAYLKHKENACQLNKLMTLAFKEYCTPKFVKDQTPVTSMLSSTHRARLLFYVNLAEQVMDGLEDQVLEEYVLPVIYPVLEWTVIVDKDLYESAHAAILSVFASQKLVSRELASVYATILLNHFHKPLTLHQVRLGYVTMVQSLCQIDDAVAWLTVQQVLQRLDNLKDEKDAVARSDYLVLLIDLLKPLSLGPFFGQALAIVEQWIKKLETKGMQQSTLKIVHETVSGSGISDMRRVQAVGWYLALKQQLAL